MLCAISLSDRTFGACAILAGGPRDQPPYRNDLIKRVLLACWCFRWTLWLALMCFAIGPSSNTAALPRRAATATLDSQDSHWQ